VKKLVALVAIVAIVAIVAATLRRGGDDDEFLDEELA
jgi:hypothetical protein